MDKEAQRRRLRGRIVAALFIGYGVIGGIYFYVRDSTSLDSVSMAYAAKGAILHAGLFSLAGLALMAWHYRKARAPYQD